MSELKDYNVIEFGVSDEVAVIFPVSTDYIEKATKAATLFLRRAGYSCKVCMVIDMREPWHGRVKAHNYGVEHTKSKYILMTCPDYFPGFNFIKKAVGCLEESGRKVFLFNDGKWFGTFPSSALVEREYARSIYGKGMCYEGYVDFCADKELSAIYFRDKQVCYHPEAVLMETDYEQLYSFKCVKGPDLELYIRRKKEGFNERH
jgi:cellulose synthase/poly-beta-1,6-N-acetylglucosamine synthase-like glycosyltransferase